MQKVSVLRARFDQKSLTLQSFSSYKEMAEVATLEEPFTHVNDLVLFRLQENHWL